MNQHYLCILLFASVAANAALLWFLASIFRKMLNAVDESLFGHLIEKMYRLSVRSPFMIIVLNLPLLLAVPYFIISGFSNIMITVGTALWLISGTISKYCKLPVYKTVLQVKGNEKDLLGVQRRKLNLVNSVQAVLYIFATVIMSLGLQ